MTAMGKVESFFKTVKAFEINGEMDGYRGVDIKEGWESLENDLTEKLAANNIHTISGFGSEYDYHMKTFYENGWMVGHQRRQQEIADREAHAKKGEELAREELAGCFTK